MNTADAALSAYDLASALRADTDALHALRRKFEADWAAFEAGDKLPTAEIEIIRSAAKLGAATYRVGVRARDAHRDVRGQGSGKARIAAAGAMAAVDASADAVEPLVRRIGAHAVRNVYAERILESWRNWEIATERNNLNYTRSREFMEARIDSVARAAGATFRTEKIGTGRVPIFAEAAR